MYSLSLELCGQVILQMAFLGSYLTIIIKNWGYIDPNAYTAMMHHVAIFMRTKGFFIFVQMTDASVFGV